MMHVARTRAYAVLDVFTGEALSGNPLAVVLDSDGLSTEDMQKIAIEFNLAETVFVFPPADEKNDAALRIFTISQELPFAGHPTVGTAVLLAKNAIGEVDEPTDKALVLEEVIGLVKAGVVVKSGHAGQATFVLPKIAEEGPPPASRVILAEALGLHEDDIGFDRHRPSIFDGGLPFNLVPVNSLDAVRRAQPDARAWSKAFGAGSHNCMYVYARGGEGENSAFHARMFGAGGTMCEDPATGSAVAAFAGAIAAFEKPADGEHNYLIEQGYEMGRPSQIMLELDIEDGEIFSARIGGEAVIVARGELFI